MERIRKLNRYQQALLLLMVLMLIVFTPIYGIASSREGFEYSGKLLLPETKDGTTVYSGKIDGKTASFTVTTDRTVTFRWGDQIFGPYTVSEDPTALPETPGLLDLPLIGMEIRKNGELLFRGGVLHSGSNWYLYPQDGTTQTQTGDILIIYDSQPPANEENEPSLPTILELVSGPKLTSGGDWMSYFYGFLISAANIVHILYADELFRHHLSFRIANAADAEPSELEIAGRYLGWTMLTGLALACFILGLL